MQNATKLKRVVFTLVGVKRDITLGESITFPDGIDKKENNEKYPEK